MRTSNKILLGGFIAAVLIIVGIHVALYAKYKSGDMVDVSFQLGGTVTQDLGNIKFVSITGMEECVVIAADTARMVMDKHWNGNYTYRVNGDSLVIDAKRTEAEYNDGRRAGLPITLYLPPVEIIKARYTGIVLLGGPDSTKAISQKLELNKSKLQLASRERGAKKHWWRDLAIDASDNTEIDFPEGGMINSLNVSLANNSSMRDQGVKVSSFQLNIDSSSSVALRMENLGKLKLNK